ncbi:MAG: NAD(P)-dependent oxidoreductase [Rhodospirillaceae bacterium]|nr:NAD(P)-dependent oxidoreductase [Rhodospirillaceae bacterium]
MTETVGFIGLGRMGRGMASNLRRKGFELVVFDIDPKPVEALVALGARAAASVAELAPQCTVVATMLPAAREVTDTLFGPDGVVALARPDTLLLEMSTVDPETTDRVHEAAAARGLRAVDAPVGRLAVHADRGESLFMVGASDADLARVRPLLEAMGTTIHHCGPAGSGTRAKLVNNLLAIVSCQLNAEALALAQRFGLDITRVLDVLYGTTATNGQLRINWPNKVLAGDTEPGFSIDLAHKDLSLIVQAANAARVPLPVTAAARECFSAARARGYGSQDFSAMVDALCDAAQVARARTPAGWKPPA